MGHSSNGYLTIIRDHTGWSLMRNRKQKNVLLNFWFKKGCQKNAGSGGGRDRSQGLPLFFFKKECCFRVRDRVRDRVRLGLGLGLG